MTSVAKHSSLVILYGIGGLSDVGRHAILAALEYGKESATTTSTPAPAPAKTVDKITVFTEYPELLDETNWESGCPEPKTNPAKTHPDIVKVIKVDNWKDQGNVDKLASHIDAADAVISCLGHRQPGMKYPRLIERGLISADGNQQVIEAIDQNNKKSGTSTGQKKRVVVISSVGIQEDWPPMEFHWAGNAMKFIFKWTKASRAFDDLNKMEVAYKEYNQRQAEGGNDDKKIDYLFVRPTGIGEEVVPEGKWWIQEEKYKGAVGMNMAKMDVARYMVEEALNPTKHERGIVIGNEPPPAEE